MNEKRKNLIKFKKIRLTMSLFQQVVDLLDSKLTHELVKDYMKYSQVGFACFICDDKSETIRLDRVKIKKGKVSSIQIIWEGADKDVPMRLPRSSPDFIDYKRLRYFSESDIERFVKQRLAPASTFGDASAIPAEGSDIRVSVYYDISTVGNILRSHDLCLEFLEQNGPEAERIISAGIQKRLKWYLTRLTPCEFLNDEDDVLTLEMYKEEWKLEADLGWTFEDYLDVRRATPAMLYCYLSASVAGLLTPISNVTPDTTLIGGKAMMSYAASLEWGHKKISTF